MKKDAPSALSFTFKKEERLAGKKIIDELFNNGSSFYLHPFRIYYLITPIKSALPARILISVPKKNFHKAVDRNRIKRLTREAYRLNKYLLYNSLKENNLHLLLAFIYSGKKMEPFELIHEKIISILKRVSQNHVIPEKNGE